LKFGIWIGLTLLALAAVGFVYNIFLGFGLTKSSGLAPDQHLSAALIANGVALVANILLIKVSHTYLKHLTFFLANSKAESNIEFFDETRETRQKAVWNSLIVIVLGLVSLVTGTISHAGRFPLIHIVFGIALVALAFITIFWWVQFLRVISRQNLSPEA